MKIQYHVFSFIIILLIISIQPLFAGVPTFTSVTTDDNDGDGEIDRLTIVFSENVDITDPGAAGDGLPCLVVTGYAIANQDYTLGNMGSLTIRLVESGTPDTDAKPDVSYTQAPAANIVSVSTAEEVADSYSFTTTSDGARPVLVAVDIRRANISGVDWWNRVLLTYSERVWCGNLAPGSGVNASDNATASFNPATEHGGDITAAGIIGGYGSFSGPGDVIVPTTENGVSVTAGGSVIFDLGRADGVTYGSIQSGTTASSGNFIPVINTGIRDSNGNSLQTTTAVSITVSNAWDLTQPTIIGAKTYDIDSDGRIDRVEFEASNPVQDDFTPSNIDINGYGGEGFSTAVTGITGGLDSTANDRYFSVTITESGFDTDHTPLYDYTGAGVYLVDLAANRLSNIASGTTSDGAPPAFTSIQTRDSDIDGHIDRLSIGFSENVTITDGGSADGLDCITVAGYTIASADYGAVGTSTLTLLLTEKSSYDTDAVPVVSYTQAGATSIVDESAGLNEMLTGETVTTSDRAGPVLLTAVIVDADQNDIDVGDYIIAGFSEPVVLGCTDSSDFVLLNSGFGDTFGTGSSLDDGTPGDDNVDIVLGSGPSLILPDLWTGPGDGNPSGLGIKVGGTTCVTDTALNSAPQGPEIDISGAGSNFISKITVSDGANTFSDQDSDSTLLDTDITISITLQFEALFVTVWYDVGENPDGISTGNSSDRRVVAAGSGQNWTATIPENDAEIVEGAVVRFIVDIDGVRYYSDGSENLGGSVPWRWTVIYEQAARVTIRNNIINPEKGDLAYINLFLSDSAYVRIKVYDVGGNFIAALHSQKDNPGAHLITWDGTNKRGRNVVRGVYFIIIRIDKKRYMKKVLVIR